MIQVILWDFDGVLLNSNAVRDLGFREVLKKFPNDQVEKLIEFHQINGGLSRYVKFRHFFEVIRGESISDEMIGHLAAEFSEIMRRLLSNHALLILENVELVQRYHRKIFMHVVSGSDQDELRFLCGQLGLSPFFRTIEGSPTPKKNLVRNILDKFSYNSDACFLVGDSINDAEAANGNGIKFIEYGNPSLKKYSTLPISELSKIIDEQNGK